MLLISISSGWSLVNRALEKKLFFICIPRAPLLALLLNQKDMNPGTSLQLYLCKMLLMDRNGAWERKESEFLSFPNTQGHREVISFVCSFFLKVVLHSILNKRCTVLSCSNETMWSTAVWVILLSLHFTAHTDMHWSPHCRGARFLFRRHP